MKHRQEEKRRTKKCVVAFDLVCVECARAANSGVRRIFQWGVSVTSHRDDVKALHYNYNSLEVLKCIVL